MLEDRLKELGLSVEEVREILDAYRGNRVAIAVWRFVRLRQKREFVPWVLNILDASYDPVKAATQEAERALLEEMIKVIEDASK